MKITFLTTSVSRALGGIYEIERNLAQALVADTPADLEIVGLADEYTQQDLPEWSPLSPNVVSVLGPKSFGYAPDLKDCLATQDPDLVHLHALWMYPSVVSLQWTRQTGTPHIITINGMLDPWAIQNARWKKRIAGWLYEDENLRTAACLQVNTEMEHRAVRDHGINTPVCIIPNGVALPETPYPPLPPWENQISEDQNVMLFLGRIHPKKGIDRLLEAWKRVQEESSQAEEWELAIVGWDDGGYLPSLKQKVAELSVADSVHFLGPMFGDDKRAAFHHADGFILPSHSEGLPMAVLEAWSFQSPVLMTPECNLPDGFEEEAAVRITTDPRDIEEGLTWFFEQDGDERHEIGKRGRKLVEAKYTWSQVAEQMHSVYEWICGSSTPPSTVHFD